MKSSIVLISLFLTLLQADYLNTEGNNQCIYNVQPYQNNTGLCYTQRSDDADYCSSSLRYKNLINGYNYISGDCLFSENLELTGLIYSDYKYLQALSGIFYGFTLTFMMAFLFLLLGRR